jgi:hypothetical protein
VERVKERNLEALESSAQSLQIVRAEWQSLRILAQNVASIASKLIELHFFYMSLRITVRRFFVGRWQRRPM